MSRRIIISDSYDPAFNLGLEEYLIETGDDILYLWQNDNTIVIGRNQNPYSECDIKKINEDKVHLVRRRSGGGAVFHDMGNLNFTIISSKHEGNIEENFEFVNKALAIEGINSEFNGRNDLHVNGKKISGNAFFDNGKTFCHHGTMLIDVDMGKLSNYLTASKLKLQSKGIKSVRSRVLNLIDINPDITVKKIKSAMIKCYSESESQEIEHYDIEKIKKDPRIMEKVKRYQSWKWIYAESPNADIKFEERFSWGIIEFNFKINNGIIENACIYTDSIINDNFNGLSKELKGGPLKKEFLKDKISENISSDIIKKDLIEKIKMF